MSFSKAVRQRIVKEFATRHNGHYNPKLFLEEVRKTGASHPAWEWFEWNQTEAAYQWQLEQARAFARDLRVTFTVTEINGGKRKVKIRESTIPMVISPIEGRKIGGGYILVDPENGSHMDEHCRQAGVALRAWIGRYGDAVKHIGASIAPVETLAQNLEQRAKLEMAEAG